MTVYVVGHISVTTAASLKLLSHQAPKSLKMCFCGWRNKKGNSARNMKFKILCNCRLSGTTFWCYFLVFKLTENGTRRLFRNVETQNILEKLKWHFIHQELIKWGRRLGIKVAFYAKPNVRLQSFWHWQCLLASHERVLKLFFSL